VELWWNASCCVRFFGGGILDIGIKIIAVYRLQYILRVPCLPGYPPPCASHEFRYAGLHGGRALLVVDIAGVSCNSFTYTLIKDAYTPVGV
jgi:hypothetical protein